MSQSRRALTSVRPWLAIVAAYALAFQVLLSGVAVGHLMAFGGATADDPFVICHGRGSGASGGQEQPDKSLPRPPCVLCTLAQAPCAILPAHTGIAVVAPIVVSNVVSAIDGRVIEFDSPTNQYQRGPPPPAVIFG